MNSTEAKLGTVALALVSTWSVAQADDFQVVVNPTTAIDNLHIFTQRIPGQPLGSAADTQALSANLGTVAANGTLTTTVSTSYGTSPTGTNDFADFSVVATNGNLGVVVGGANGNSTFNYNDSFPAISQGAAFSAIAAGDLVNVKKLYNQGRQYGNDVFASRDNGVQTGTLFFFDANGTQNRIGTYTVTPVPEPATMAVLGLGVAAMVRRRRQRNAG